MCEFCLESIAFKENRGLSHLGRQEHSLLNAAKFSLMDSIMKRVLYHQQHFEQNPNPVVMLKRTTSNVLHYIRSCRSEKALKNISRLAISPYKHQYYRTSQMYV